MIKMKNYLLLLGGLLWGLTCQATSLKKIEIQSETGPVSYQIEVAQTQSQREKGLMGRKNLPPHQGMIFLFPQKQVVNMWMKDTYIPLDMLFIDDENRIVHLHEKALPFDKTIISSVFPVSKVLEINAQEIQKNKIKVGQKIFFTK